MKCNYCEGRTFPAAAFEEHDGYQVHIDVPPLHEASQGRKLKKVGSKYVLLHAGSIAPDLIEPMIEP